MNHHKSVYTSSVDQTVGDTMNQVMMRQLQFSLAMMEQHRKTETSLSIPQGQRISYMPCHLDPMCYPILFPRGDLGWHDGMVHTAEHRTSSRNRLTMQQFYGYRLAVRSGFNPHSHSAGKLFQQYAVDAYVKTEGCRLYIIRSNQAQLRVELYSG